MHAELCGEVFGCECECAEAFGGDEGEWRDVRGWDCEDY